MEMWGNILVNFIMFRREIWSIFGVCLLIVAAVAGIFRFCRWKLEKGWSVGYEVDAYEMVFTTLGKSNPKSLWNIHMF